MYLDDVVLHPNQGPFDTPPCGQAAVPLALDTRTQFVVAFFIEAFSFLGHCEFLRLLLRCTALTHLQLCELLLRREQASGLGDAAAAHGQLWQSVT